MFNQTYKILFIVLTVLLGLTATSCIDDLNTSPLDDDVVTSESIYNTPEEYKQVLAKIYAGFATTGQASTGQADIQGIDEGFSSYIRQLFTLQENPTDEAIIGWGDEGLPDLNTMSWTASNDFVMAMYSRIYYTIAMTNEFIRNAEGREEAVIQEYMAEARFIRALSYWHALDLYGGNIPFVTEENEVGAALPERTNAEDLFAYIESELMEIESDLIAPGQNEYGRVDRAAAWMLLSKLYLNAEVYIGEDRYDDVITYTENILDDGAYQLHDSYQELFLADNHTADGIIFPVVFDGINITGYGGTTFIAHAAVGGNMSAADFGLNGGWGGYRTLPQFVEKFEGEDYSGYETSNQGGNDEIYVPGGYQSSSGYTTDWTPADAPPLVSENNDDIYTGYVYFADAAEFKFTTERNWDNDYGSDDGELVAGGNNFSVSEGGLYYFEVNLNTNELSATFNVTVNPDDSRSMFFTDGQTREVEDPGDFSNGYTITKWKNINSDGSGGKDLEFADIDFPMFRLADVYLMYAEATARGANGGDNNRAVNLINELRERSYGDNSGDITAGDLTPEFVLDERARELYWEGHRRTDLIRFGLFTSGDYVWAWKGDDQEGSAVSDHFNIYPIPASDVNANPNLEQNPGY
ncbi:MAG: RagB/SusD family nutrient uptake outer membrane protein [Gracilimonas sp.]